MNILQIWWFNNNWRFWQIRWALAGEPNLAVEVWQEYRYMLNPDDARSLVDLILEEYDKDVELAMKNPIVKLVFWTRRLAHEL